MLMKPSLILILTLLTLPAFAQEEEPDQIYFKEKVSTRRDKEADQIIEEIFAHYEKRAESFTSKETASSHKVADIPKDPETWWLDGVTGSLRNDDRNFPESQQALFKRALKNSTQIKVFGDLPLIRETGIQEARGTFDTNAFAESFWRSDNKPVGSSLQTGGPSRFEEDDFQFEFGVRKKLIFGTEVTLSQRLGDTRNNSTFFTPSEQGSSELALTITQPILKGAGIKYNSSIMEVARFDTKMAMSEFMRQTEAHLLEVSRGYWSLYLARAIYMEKLRLVSETNSTVGEIESRKDIDTLTSQLLRARSAYAIRNADTIRSEMAIRNAEARIKALVNAPEYLESSNTELIPLDLPILRAPAPSMKEVAVTALRSRPEIKQAILQLRSSIIRKDMQKNELMPQLNLVLRGSVAGLEGNGRVDDALGSQFDTGSPSYEVGLVFSVPLENNFARARYQRRLLEMRQQIEQVNTTIETVLLEVQVALRELVTSQRDLRAKYAAAEAASADLKSMNERKGLEMGLGNTASDPAGAAPTTAPSTENAGDYLERLLDSQDRNSLAREDFLRSLVVYNVAIINLERAKGSLLQYEDVSISRKGDEANPKLPIFKLSKDGRISSDK